MRNAHFLNKTTATHRSHRHTHLASQPEICDQCPNWSQSVPIDSVSHHASHRKLETVVLTSFASFSSTSTSSINIKATANIHSWFRRKDLERFSVQAESCLKIFAQFPIDPLSVLLPFFAFCPDGPFAVGMPGVHDLVHISVWKWNQ